MLMDPRTALMSQLMVSPPLPLTLMFQQITHKGNFSQDQNQDNQLKNCWRQVCQAEGEDQQARHPLCLVYFLIQGGLLYYHFKCQG